MVKATIRYPGDPDEEVVLMFGAEFQVHVRKGKPGVIRVTGLGPDLQPIIDHSTQIIEFNEIICDDCNAQITDLDPLALLYRSRAVCWQCYVDHWKKNVVAS
jgi:hypothetical protein